MNRSTQSLILNVIFPSLFVGALAGATVGYFMAKGGPVPIEQQIANKEKAAHPGAATIIISNANPATGTSATSSTAGAQTVAQNNIGKSETLAASVTDGTYPTPAPELIDKLSDKTWLPGVVQSKDRNDKTGETDTAETLPDGANAKRTYRNDGSLKAESITSADGSEMNRSFFENGNVKIAFTKDANGAETSVLYDSTGVITQHTTVFPDHTQIYSEYNDHGEIVHTWRLFPDGHSEPYPPASNDERDD